MIEDFKSKNYSDHDPVVNCDNCPKVSSCTSGMYLKGCEYFPPKPFKSGESFFKKFFK